MKTTLTVLFILLALLISDNLEASEPDYENMTVAEILAKSLEESVQETAEEIEDKFSFTMIYGGWSNHFRKSTTGYHFNSNHEFVGFEYQNWLAVTFINSFRDRTYGVGYDFNWELTDKMSYGVIAGITYGYDEKDMEGSPFNLVHNGFGPLFHAYVDYQVYKDETMEFRPNIGLNGTTLLLLLTSKF